MTHAQSSRTDLEPVIAQLRTFFADVLGARSLPSDLEIGPATGLPGLVEVTSKTHPAGDPTLWVHGGAYVAGSVRQAVGPLAALVRASGLRGLAPEYPLAPEHPYPAAADYLLAAYRQVVARTGAERLVVGGDSAGGGLALAMVLAARDAGLALPRALVLWSPAVDLASSGPSFRDRSHKDPVLDPSLLAVAYSAYLSGTAADDPRINPLHADLRGLPPTLIQVGTSEILLDDALALAARIARHDGTVTLDVITGGTHGLQSKEDDASARAAVARTTAFIGRR